VSAAPSLDETENALSTGTALAQFLYSPPMAASIRKCVENLGAAYESEIRARMQNVENLQTKSLQREAVARISEDAKGLPYVARARCMTTALVYLVRVNGAIKMFAIRPNTVSRSINVDELVSTIDDLSKSGRQSLSAALESYPREVDAYHDQHFVDDLVIGFVRSVQLCFQADEIARGDSGVGEEQWKKSCQLAEVTGLSTADVRTPDFQGSRDTSASKRRHQDRGVNWCGSRETDSEGVAAERGRLLPTDVSAPRRGRRGNCKR
jgi:hypothetical protein